MPESRPLILIPGRIHPHVADRLATMFDIVRAAMGEPGALPDGISQRVRGIASMTRIDAALIDALPDLEIIANFGVGYDAVDAAHAARRQVMVTNTPDVLTEEVADTALGLLLATVRELTRAEAWLRDGRWKRDGAYPLTTLSLRGRRIGIFGMGRIGLAIARRLEAFGLPIHYHNRNPVPDMPYRWHPSLLDLATAVDTIVSVAPGGRSTDKAVNAAILEALGPDGVFINIGRGSTVHEDALADALHAGRIAAAGLDVFADEPNVPERLLTAPNTVLLPHVGSASQHTRRAMADLVVDNLVTWFDGKPPLTPVPETRDVDRRRPA